ncbi:RNA polymerase sigma-70 factor [Rhodohalobacter sp. 8-1]|uniref:RNA polymerase sigma-70 factor n=1 Tax=Rhodohalobacter sp. 8-1 TaxID=3131972 RepID=UPI0030EE5CF9
MKKHTEQQLTEWAEKISRSDQRAFDELFRAFYPILVRFAMRYVSNSTTSKDIVQECFITLWKTRTRIDASRSLKSYLYMMVRNKALNTIRDNSGVDIDHELASDQQMNQQPDEIEQEYESSKLERKLQLWIGLLPDRQKEAFRLSRFDGLDHDEIAEVMSVSPKTVNNHIVAALSTLRNRYEQYKNEIKG